MREVRTWPKGGTTRDVKVSVISAKQAEDEFRGFGMEFPPELKAEGKAVVKINLPGTEYAQGKYSTAVATSKYENGRPIAQDLIYQRRAAVGAQKSKSRNVTHVYYKFSPALIQVFEDLEFGEGHQLHNLKTDKPPTGPGRGA